MAEYTIQVNTAIDTEIEKMLDFLCASDMRNRAQMVRWLIREEYTRRYPQEQTQAQPLAVAAQ